MNNEILPGEMRRVISRRRFLEYIAFGTGLLAWPLNIKAETKHYLIVGAGIVGTAIAYALEQAGEKVTLIDKDFPAAHASGKTFAWINATYPKQSFNYHLLSRLGVNVYQKWDAHLELKINWKGSLEWFKNNDENQNMLKKVEVIQSFGSEAEIISKEEALGYEPNVLLNQNFITRSPRDGVINPVQAIKKMIQGIKNKGGKVIFPAEFLELTTNKGGVIAKTSHGLIRADKIVYACGTGSNLVAQGEYLKPPTPGLIVTSKPFKQTINKILVGPGVHVYQRRDGVVILGEQGKPPTNHDQRLSQRPEQFPNQPLSIEHGQRIVKLAANFIPKFKDLLIEKVEIGWRPLPLDGKPVIGFLNKYEYLATMHSGISLAPIVAELVRDELMFDVKSELLNDFRPQRFL